jgi:ubiquinone/menaquinone biosynthesis C-methylase UbiE
MMQAHDDSQPDLNAVFEAANYLYFYHDDFLTDERTNIEVQFLRERFGVGKGMSILDLACGHGRHANHLAREAHHVVGIDTCASFLDIARKRAEDERLCNVTYLEMDIRQIDFSIEFERVILLNTVFGLFSDDENIELLRRISKALKPGGKLCLDVINRDTILVDFQPDSVFEKDGNIMLDRLSFNEHTGRMSNKRKYIRDGRTTEAPFSIRLYNYSEIAAILSGAKLEIVETFADWEGTPMNWRAKKIIIVARKAEREEMAF